MFVLPGKRCIISVWFKYWCTTEINLLVFVYYPCVNCVWSSLLNQDTYFRTVDVLFALTYIPNLKISIN